MTVNGNVSIVDENGDPDDTGEINVTVADVKDLEVGTPILTFKYPTQENASKFVVSSDYTDEGGNGYSVFYSSYLNGSKLVSGQAY